MIRECGRKKKCQQGKIKKKKSVVKCTRLFLMAKVLIRHIDQIKKSQNSEKEDSQVHNFGQHHPTNNSKYAQR